ncbi:TolC family protein [Hydrogenimonas cancrithermarum]|uniref:Heavy metal RND efflux outer membrane protein, CzcC family n=1 Tax=Hydrogenimonas cancrithermarum TaxID=2993563 RepID=A0ABN6WWW9_9BACT|nr:TolC family protein [Hydrogenimonas cancrithermarum]BDY13719.1 hypothetical protein HCR_20310 [Hydrogenimonas cancrithermarum]
MRLWLLFIVFVASVQATTLQQLIDSALANHPSLDVAKSRIAAADYAVQRAKNFDNPVLGLSVNDLRLDDFTNRSLEPMQTQAVTLSQKIPWFGKRETKKAIEEAKKSLLFASMKEAEAELVARIRQNGYRIWEIERLIAITRDTIALTEQNIELYEAYTASSESGNTHMGIMSAELVKSRLKTSLSRFEAQKAQTLALLEYLSFQSIDHLQVDLPAEKLLPLQKLKEKIVQSPSLKSKMAGKDVVKEKLSLARTQTSIDPVLRVGYYQRASYDDYISIGVGFAMPVYGTEKSKIEETRANLLAQRSNVADTKMRLTAKLEELYARAKSEREILQIVKNESLPQIGHMFDLIRADIAAGGDLYKFVDLVEQKLALEAQAILARANFHKTMAQIDALLGEY